MMSGDIRWRRSVWSDLRRCALAGTPAWTLVLGKMISLMTRRLFAISGGLIVAVALSSCTSGVKKQGSLPVVELRQEWFPNANFAGEVSASKRFAQTEHIQLKIVPGAEDVDPIKVVLSGGADFGVVGGDLLVAAVSKGAPLVAIGVANYKSPTCFLVKAKSGIKGPADFLGKRVGILAGTNTERIYQLMMKRSGYRSQQGGRKYRFPLSFRPSRLANTTYVLHFIYDEPVSLEQQGISYELIDPAQYGVNFTGTVYFTRRDVIETKRPLAKALVKSLVKGWTYTRANPEESLSDVLAAYPSLKRDRESRSLQLALPYFAGENGKPLMASAETWQAMISGLEEIAVIAPKSVRVEQVWDASLVNHAVPELKQNGREGEFSWRPPTFRRNTTPTGFAGGRSTAPPGASILMLTETVGHCWRCSPKGRVH